MTVSKGVTVLTKGDTPKKLRHRTAAAILQGILATGLIPGSNSSGRARNYLSAVGVDDAQYKSGTCSNQPIETALDTLQAAEDLEATREGEPQFRAKREYEEVASSSSGPAMPKAQTAKAKPVVTKAMPKAKPTSFIDKAINVAVTEDDATRNGATDDGGSTTEAEDGPDHPFGSYPCHKSQAVVATGMIFCVRCGAAQTVDSSRANEVLPREPAAPEAYPRNSCGRVSEID